MSLLNRKSFPSGPFSVFFHQAAAIHIEKLFYISRASIETKRKGVKIGKKCLNRKFPSNRTGHRSTGATKNGFIVAPSLPEFQSDREKISEKDKKRNEPNPILDFKNFGWSWLQLHFQSWRHDS